MQDIPPQGSIDDIFLPRLVTSLHLREFEGTLRLILPDSLKVLYFKRGEIASAASNSEPDRLANILIRDGRLTPEQLELARSRLPSGASLGKVLIEMGFLSPSELLQGARQQVRVIVTSCFTATSGTYEMIPGPLPAEVTSLGLNTRRLLFDALMEAGDRAAIIREVGSMERVYRSTDQLHFILASLKLEAERDRVGRLLDGVKSLRDISGKTSCDDLTVSKVVLALELLGGAEGLEPPEEPTRVASVESTAAALPQVRQDVPVSREEPVSREAEPESSTAEPGSREVEVPSHEAGPVPVPATKIPLEPVDESSPSFVLMDTSEEAPGPGTVSGPEAAPGSEAADASVLSEAMETAPAEPPPIPDHELPAFARSSEEIPPGAPTAVATGAEPQWQIDPVTGERVHVGPIEITFDGRIASDGGEPKNLMWILLAAGAITLVVAGALGYVILRRGAVVPEGEVASLESRSVAAPPSKTGGTTLKTSPGEALAAAGESPATGRSSAPVEPTAGGAPSVAASPAPTAAPAPRQAAEIKRAAPAPLSTPPSRPAAQARGPLVDPRYDAALLRLDQGDVAAAARMFEEWVVASSPNGYSLQFMIACQDETVRGARSRSGAGGALIILPYSLKGRACYRVLWGVYGDSGSARAAIPGLPPSLTSETPPVVVSLLRAKPSG